MRGKFVDRHPYNYSCFGLHIRSDLALPEIASTSILQDNADLPIVEIRRGVVPAELPDLDIRDPNLQVSGRDVLLTVEGTARYLVRDGREIIVDPSPESSERNVRLYLLGSAFGIHCHQRGLLPLHANAIVANEQAIAFAGTTGAGKSTLAAHFQRVGYEVLSDDVCVLSFDAAGRPLAWPGLPRLKLWRDAAGVFGYDSGLLEQVVDGLEKYHVPFPRPARAGPVVLQRLYMLGKTEPGTASQIVRIRGVAAYEALLSETYRNQYLGPMGLRQRHLDQIKALLRHIEVYSAPRDWGYDVFAREAEKLERHLLEA